MGVTKQERMDRVKFTMLKIRELRERDILSPGASKNASFNSVNLGMLLRDPQWKMESNDVMSPAANS